MQSKVSLRDLNTFQVDVTADQFLEINSIEDLKEVSKPPILFLGQGANILLTHDIVGLVVKNNLQGHKIVTDTDQDVVIEVQSGHDWHAFVTWAVENNFSGVENMALIPGTVGAAMVGNIAAYGQSFEDVFDGATVFNIATHELQEFSKAECKFAYRESALKHTTQFFVVAVRIKLSKTAHLETAYHSRYESLLGELTTFAKPPYSIKNVYQAVVRLRTRKLPDWTMLGTAGSFFKNPNVTLEHYETLKKTLPDLQSYPAEKLSYNQEVSTELVKIPAGRLLDHLGWKGKTIGRVGTFKNHALVIVNTGGATGQEILEFSKLMQKSVKDAFNIDLEPEVIII